MGLIIGLLFVLYVVFTIQPKGITQFYPVAELTEDLNGIKHRKWVIRLQKKGKWIPFLPTWGFYGVRQTKWDEIVLRYDDVSDAKMEMVGINFGEDPKKYWVNGTFDIDETNLDE